MYHKENMGSLFKMNWTIFFLTVSIILLLLSYRPMMDSCQAVVDNACDYCGKENACNICVNSQGTLKNDDVKDGLFLN